MPVYTVERNLSGISIDQLGGAQQAAIATSEQFTNQVKIPLFTRIVETLDVTPAPTT